MPGKSSRSKGQRAQRSAEALLKALGWNVISTSSGKAHEDLVATDDQGKTWSIEVKDQRLINLPKWTCQAMTQASARKLPWLLMCHIPDTHAWLVLKKSMSGPEVWMRQHSEPPLLGKKRALGSRGGSPLEDDNR